MAMILVPLLVMTVLPIPAPINLIPELADQTAQFTSEQEVLAVTIGSSIAFCKRPTKQE
jgi:hypothetical protein